MRENKKKMQIRMSQKILLEKDRPFINNFGLLTIRVKSLYFRDFQEARNPIKIPIPTPAPNWDGPVACPDGPI